jgi:uncharacterized protein (TIGR02594 family)
MDTKNYFVRNGDTLEKIAAYFDLSITALLQMNPPVSQAAGLKPMDSLNIPAKEEKQMSLHLALARSLFPAEVPWLAIALREEKSGIKEWPDPLENPVILEYLQSVGIGKGAVIDKNTGDEILWCSAFVNWCFAQAGYRGTKSGLADSWDSWGRELDKPRRGCVVRFRFTKGNHVGFFLEDYSAEKLHILGGNQSDQVISQDYSKNTAKCYRWPQELPS